MLLPYDFHLHSCLSPCGDNDMTPYNLVNMARLWGLEVIALTDHNTVGNCRSAMAVGADIGLTVIPGMELCTAEEIHVVCLFPDLEKAEAFGAAVRAQLPPIKNKPGIYGEQRLMDTEDNVIGLEETLLVTASFITIDQVPGLCGQYGGFCYPAHIDRSSFSILSTLGTITTDMGFTCAEVSAGGDEEALAQKHTDLQKMRLLRSSDAHYLENMREAVDTIEVPANTAPAIVAYLRSLTAQ